MDEASSIAASLTVVPPFELRSRERPQSLFWKVAGANLRGFPAPPIEGRSEYRTAIFRNSRRHNPRSVASEHNFGLTFIEHLDDAVLVISEEVGGSQCR